MYMIRSKKFLTLFCHKKDDTFVGPINAIHIG